MWKWRKLKKEKMKLGNVGKVPVGTQNGDPHKEDIGQSTHALELAGVSAELKPILHQRQHCFKCHNVGFHRSHSCFLKMTVCDILLSLVTSLRTGILVQDIIMISICPQHNLGYFKKGVFYSGIKTYNHLPLNIKELSNGLDES
jgi:hypothetical protein